MNSDNAPMTGRGETLLLSQDYELFFGDSGSVEKCLLEPSAALRQFAGKMGVKFTFFVDAGMLVWLDRFRSLDPALPRLSSTIRSDIERLAIDGHEIGLHVHPHWEDTRWANGRWDFSGTRFRLAEFTESEVAEIIRNYTAILAEISGVQPTSYRAGGFCVEPFELVRSALAAEGVFIDSSVVPGASLIDDKKGFDFRYSPGSDWWFFDKSPLLPEVGGRFLEIPVQSFSVSRGYYWGRLLDRLRGRRSSPVFGDGNSKAIGRTEIVRRLIGQSRVAELSIDEPKAEFLGHVAATTAHRPVWSIMGHPKLLSPRSLEFLEGFIRERQIREFSTVSEFGLAIRSAQSE